MNSLDKVIDDFLKAFLPEMLPATAVNTKKKIIRDAVWGMIQLEPHEVLILDTYLFQRLRGIFQTGLAYLVYPCAGHSRFEHSLGCLHVAGRMLDALWANTDHGDHHFKKDEKEKFDATIRPTVRLAALLHDISHCIFSHVSEDIYGQDARLRAAQAAISALFQPQGSTKKPGAAEVLAYKIITSPRFQRFFEQLRERTGLSPSVTTEDVARLIIGLPPRNNTADVYLAQIINGPFDADKLDYQIRDGRYTGIGFSVDVERLLASLCVARQKGELFLAVDYRGVTPIEQLIVNRMLLYDSVYHHAKVRAAVRLFREYFAQRPGLLSLDWLLPRDEYDFFGNPPTGAGDIVSRLRKRDLPYRALVLNSSTIEHPARGESAWIALMKRWSTRDEHDRTRALETIETIKREISNHTIMSLADSKEFYIDLPGSPEYQELLQQTYIWLSADETRELEDVFPINKSLQPYARHYKYRAYIFATKENREHVAAAAFAVLKDHRIFLNQEAFRRAKLLPERISELLGGVRIPPLGKHPYMDS